MEVQGQYHQQKPRKVQGAVPRSGQAPCAILTRQFEAGRRCAEHSSVYGRPDESVDQAGIETEKR